MIEKSELSVQALQSLKQLKVLLFGSDKEQQEDKLLLFLLNYATQLAFSHLYPFEKDTNELTLTPFQEQWVIITAKLIYDSKEFSNMIKYSENGIEFEFNPHAINGIPLSHFNTLGLPKASVFYE